MFCCKTRRSAREETAKAVLLEKNNFSPQPIVPEKDMAVLLVFFNPCNSKRILINFLYIFNGLRAKNVPVFGIECLFPGQEPSISFKNVKHVRSSSYLFHKERLFRVLEKSIPQKYTKLMMMDADLFYDEENWYEVVSNDLNIHECLQPFKIVNYLDLTYKNKYISAKPVVLLEDAESNPEYQVGMVWAMTREYYNKCGFYDNCIIGNGDLLSAVHFTGKTFEKSKDIILRLHGESYAEYCKKPRPKSIKHCDLTLNHMYHGSLIKRKYWDRNFLFKEIEGDVSNLIKENEDGVFEWKTPEDTEKWNKVIFEHFSERKDDEMYHDIDVSVTAKVIL
jgi:hypothetical protein